MPKHVFFLIFIIGTLLIFSSCKRGCSCVVYEHDLEFNDLNLTDSQLNAVLDRALKGCESYAENQALLSDTETKATFHCNFE